eukprot:968612-Pyramimonas_sp.AAC.2
MIPQPDNVMRELFQDHPGIDWAIHKADKLSDHCACPIIQENGLHYAAHTEQQHIPLTSTQHARGK